MGVPGLFKQIVRRYKECYFFDKAKQKIVFQHFYIDFNPIIYGAYAKVVKTFKESRKTLSSKDQIEVEIIKQVLLDTKNLIGLVNPEVSIYIAIDGPAPKAKMVQQRNRRYKKLYEEHFKGYLRTRFNEPVSGLEWNTTSISPGTEFMTKLSTALKNSLKSKTMGIPVSGCQVVLSDSSIPGEGEHKFLKDIEALTPKGQNVSIFSNDGDLLILCNRFRDQNIFVFRDITPTDPLRSLYPTQSHVFFDTQKYQIAFLTEIGLLGPEADPVLLGRDSDRTMWDFMLFSFIGGNDFVQPFNFSKMKERHTFKMLLGTYKTLVKDKYNQDYLVFFGANTENVRTHGAGSSKIPLINHEFLIDFIELMCQQERLQLQRLNKKIRTFNRNAREPRRDQEISEYDYQVSLFEHTYFYSEYHPLYTTFKDEFRKIDYSKNPKVYKEQYYKEHFGFDTCSGRGVRGYNLARGRVCRHYLESIVFTLRYYLKDLPSWVWFNRNPTAPFASDVLFTLKKMKQRKEDVNDIIKFHQGTPYRPFEQLMMILPSNNKLLPKEYLNLMKKYPEMYPSSFDLDVISGEKYIYSEPKLPVFNEKDIMPEIRKLEKCNNVNNALNTKPFYF